MKTPPFRYLTPVGVENIRAYVSIRNKKKFNSQINKIIFKFK